MKRMVTALLCPLLIACMLLPLGCADSTPAGSESDSETTPVTTAAETLPPCPYHTDTAVYPDNLTNPGTTETVKSLEQHLCERLEGEAFELKTILVDTCECHEHHSMLSFSGILTKNGTEEEWKKTYSISYPTFLLLYKVRGDWMLYNAEPREHETQILTLNDIALQTILEVLA